MPPPRFTTKYTGPSSSGADERGYFYFRLLGLESLLANYRGAGKEFQRELSKELDLMKADLEEVYRAYAPVKEGMGGFTDEAHWSNDRPLLRDTIEARKALKATTLEVRMAWWGHFSTDGRAAQGPRSKAYRIELPGGEVIYRRRTDRATSHDLNGVSAQRRMEWPKEAYENLKKNKVFQVHAENLAYRFYWAIFKSLTASGAAPNVARLVAGGVVTPSERAAQQGSYASQLRAAKERRNKLRSGQSPKHRQYAHAGRPRVEHAPTLKQLHHEKHQEITHEALSHEQRRKQQEEFFQNHQRKLYHKAFMQRFKAREAKGLEGSRLRAYSVEHRLRREYERMVDYQTRNNMKHQPYEVHYHFLRHNFIKSRPQRVRIRY